MKKKIRRNGRIGEKGMKDKGERGERKKSGLIINSYPVGSLDS